VIPTWWLAVGCLTLAAVVAGWPTGRWRARRRMVLDRRDPNGPTSDQRWSRSGYRWPVSGWWPSAVPAWAVKSPRQATLLVATGAAGAGAVAGGPVGAVAGAAYGGLAARGLLRLRAVRQAERERRRRLDGLSALAADLRAGLPVSDALSAFGSPESAGPSRGGLDRLTLLARAAVGLAEQTGAPLAELLERIEADARTTDRGLAAAAAQAAGARATAWLLAALPLGGIALGYGIGADPVDVLLHTPIGAGCAVGAIALQIVGLAWADRLSGRGRRAG
jgi:tight adherence protein B